MRYIIQLTNIPTISLHTFFLQHFFLASFFTQILETTSQSFPHKVHPIQVFRNPFHKTLCVRIADMNSLSRLMLSAKENSPTNQETFKHCSYTYPTHSSCLFIQLYKLFTDISYLSLNAYQSSFHDFPF